MLLFVLRKVALDNQRNESLLRSRYTEEMTELAAFKNGNLGYQAAKRHNIRKRNVKIRAIKL